MQVGAFQRGVLSSVLSLSLPLSRSLSPASLPPRTTTAPPLDCMTGARTVPNLFPPPLHCPSPAPLLMCPVPWSVPRTHQCAPGSGVHLCVRVDGPSVRNCAAGAATQRHNRRLRLGCGGHQWEVLHGEGGQGDGTVLPCWRDHRRTRRLLQQWGRGRLWRVRRRRRGCGRCTYL